MTDRAVHWHDGIFLWPQHLQQAERHGAHQFGLNQKWDVHYNWGLRACELDEQALGSWQFVVRRLVARLPGGTLVAVPEEASLAALDLKGPLEREDSITVFLAVPQLRLGKPNAVERHDGAAASEDRQAGEVRYLVEMEDVEDENTGADAQPVRVRLLNAKLLLSTQSHAGYEVLPLARISKREALPQLDETYIPPLLACDAWKPLRAGILQAIYDRIGRLIESRVAQATSLGVSFDTRSPGDAALLSQLHGFNKAQALWHILAFAEGVHPLPAYLELCRLAGQMAIFDKLPRAPTLPVYDHDDLGGCFFRVKVYLDGIDLPDRAYEERPFVREKQRMQVTLEPKWLKPGWDMYVGVHSSLRPEECINLLTRTRQLNMKIGSSLCVDQIFSGGAQGLRFTPAASPQHLPLRAGLVYLQVSSEPKGVWQNVQKSLTLAIRLLESPAGNSQGGRSVTVTADGVISPMQFTLYLVPRENTSV